MTKKYSIAEARDNLPGVVHEVEGGTRVELTRRGKPVAVLLGIEEYERLAEGRRSFWEAYEEFRRELDPVQLGIEPDEVFKDVRDPSLGQMPLGSRIAARFAGLGLTQDVLELRGELRPCSGESGLEPPEL